MARLFVNKKVLRRAKALVAEGKRPEPAADQPLPVISVLYPRHGAGDYTLRFVRVFKADDKHIKGFEIQSEFDEEPGKPKTFRRDRIADLQFLHL